jgi:hypothetical protein
MSYGTIAAGVRCRPRVVRGTLMLRRIHDEQIAYECDEPMRVTFNVTGPLIWLDENGEPNGTFDVFDYIALVRDHYEKNGIGADYIDQLMR